MPLFDPPKPPPQPSFGRVLRDLLFHEYGRLRQPIEIVAAEAEAVAEILRFFTPDTRKYIVERATTKAETLGWKPSEL